MEEEEVICHHLRRREVLSSSRLNQTSKKGPRSLLKMNLLRCRELWEDAVGLEEVDVG